MHAHPHPFRTPRSTTLLPLLILLAAGIAPPAAGAEPTVDDLRLLGLMYRNRSGEYRSGGDADPAVLEALAALEAESGGGDGGLVDRYRSATRALTLLRRGAWNDRLEVATMLDMRITAKTFEQGGAVGVNVRPLFTADPPPGARVRVSVRLENDQGAPVGESVSEFWTPGEPLHLDLGLPDDIAPGAWSVRYTLNATSLEAETAGVDGAEAEELISARRTIFVVKRLGKRLDELEARLTAIGGKDESKRTARQEVALTTLRWHMDAQRRARREDFPGAYGGHPIFMTESLDAAGLVQERMDFVGELEFAEALAAALDADEDPLAGRKGDMRLAYVSPEDGELVPFRVYLPPSFSIYLEQPVAVALHGAGGDENTYMDGFGESFKRLAAERGYVAVAPNGRGPFSMYVGKAARDPMDVLDVLRRIMRVNEEYICLTGHSMGGSGALRIGFDNPGTFASVAPVAGFGSTDLLLQAPFMPLLICAGAKDALVSVESARALHTSAEEAGMKNLRYLELPDAGHTDLPEKVMKDVFDWFDAHRKG